MRILSWVSPRDYLAHVPICNRGRALGEEQHLKPHFFSHIAIIFALSQITF